MKIDTHHHFWRYHPDEYGWMNDRMGVIRRDFLPGDLRKEISQVGIEGVISVQARQTIEETDWLLHQAGQQDFIKGVVGWVPLIESNVEEYLDRYDHEPLLKGVRHVLHDESDDLYMLRDDFNRGISRLKSRGLVYDILIFESHLPQTIKFVDRHPEQIFVVDHIAKPRIKDNILEPWKTLINSLAERENCYCKLSGLITEADWSGWSIQQLRPYFDIILEAFSPGRLMFGSDWPVCLVAGSYAGWYRTVEQLCTDLAENERVDIRGRTAERVYNL